jgi:hypothetical protein
LEDFARNDGIIFGDEGERARKVGSGIVGTHLRIDREGWGTLKYIQGNLREEWEIEQV